MDSEADLLRRGGHEVNQVFARNPDSWLPALTSVATAPWNRATARRVREEVRAFNPDVAHIHNTWFAMSASVIWALKKEEVPVVMTLHNYRLLCANGLL